MRGCFDCPCPAARWWGRRHWIGCPVSNTSIMWPQSTLLIYLGRRQWIASLFGLISNDAFSPIDFKRPRAFTALVDFLSHRIVHGNGEQLLTVWALNLSLSGNGTGKAEFVHQEIFKE